LADRRLALSQISPANLHVAVIGQKKAYLGI
jgi:hypothetical protein